jgi:hypothetical protein
MILTPIMAPRNKDLENDWINNQSQIYQPRENWKPMIERGETIMHDLLQRAALVALQTNAPTIAATRVALASSLRDLRT